MSSSVWMSAVSSNRMAWHMMPRSALWKEFVITWLYPSVKSVFTPCPNEEIPQSALNSALTSSSLNAVVFCFDAW